MSYLRVFTKKSSKKVEKKLIKKEQRIQKVRTFAPF